MPSCFAAAASDCSSGGDSSRSPATKPGDEVAEMVVEPPDDWPLPPRDSGGGDELGGGTTPTPTDSDVSNGVRFFCAFSGEPSDSLFLSILGRGEAFGLVGVRAAVVGPGTAADASAG